LKPEHFQGIISENTSTAMTEGCWGLNNTGLQKERRMAVSRAGRGGFEEEHR
jgi:hypothetical protein